VFDVVLLLMRMETLETTVVALLMVLWFVQEI
jgi:hypothetical protein